jgi:hypothetical protein
VDDEGAGVGSGLSMDVSGAQRRRGSGGLAAGMPAAVRVPCRRPSLGRLRLARGMATTVGGLDLSPHRAAERGRKRRVAVSHDLGAGSLTGRPAPRRSAFEFEPDSAKPHFVAIPSRGELGPTKSSVHPWKGSKYWAPPAPTTAPGPSERSSYPQSLRECLNGALALARSVHT